MVQETEYNIQAGFIIFIPLYNKNLQPATLDERKSLFKGYVYSPFRMKDLIRATLQNDLRNINIQIYDGLDTIPKNLMYNSDSLYSAVTEKDFTRLSKLDLYGKTWTLKYTALPEFIESFKSEKPRIVLLSGLLISLLFFLVTISFVNSKKTSKKLSEVLEATGEGIFGVDNSLKCTFINSSALDMLGYKISECLNKNIHEFIRCKEVDGKICNADQCPLIQTVKKGITNSTSEIVLERKDKSELS